MPSKFTNLLILTRSGQQPLETVFCRVCVLSLVCILFLIPSFATVQAQSSSLQIYTFRTKTPVLNLPASVQYEITGQENNWRYIQFNEPVVPVWVSANHTQIDEESGLVTVTTNSLNARLNAALSARVVNQIDSGYQSEMLERSGDFVRIFAPTDFQFAIDSQQLTNINVSQNINSNADSGSRWVLQSTNDDSSNIVMQGISSAEEDPVASQPIVQNQSAQVQAETSAPVQPNQPLMLEQRTNQYRLASGDSISVTVFGESDLNIPSTRIPQSGTISFPLIGPLQVSGKTARELEVELIAAFSRGYINNPQLTVSIDGYQPIFIRGAVSSIGSFTYTEGLTVAQALSLAGGTTRSAKAFGVSVERAGQLVFEELSLNSNQQILPGDILSVDEEIGVTEEVPRFYVYLHGEVNRPGEYQFRPGLTVEKAVVLAGGFNLRASKRKISVSRHIDDLEIPEVMEKVPLYLPVQPGDIINVGASWF